MNAEAEYSLAKHLYFTRFCQHLGAREITVEKAVCRTSIRELAAEVGSDTSQKAKGLVKAEFKESDDFALKEKLLAKLPGGERNRKAAVEWAEKKGIISDKTVEFLLDSASDENNPLGSFDFVLELTNDAQKNLDVAAKLEFPTSLKSLNAGLRQNLRIKIEYKYMYRLLF
jgi:hypothetical protein